MDYTYVIEHYLKEDFDAKIVIEDIVANIKDWFDKNGPDSKAVIGISGGKDSTILAKLCCMALGRERVVGVLMPNGKQKDISDSYLICALLGIESHEVNIEGAYKSILEEITKPGLDPDYKQTTLDIAPQTEYNLPPRLRMATLYAIAQSINGRVMNTSNASESYIGWSTIHGDSVGDFYPLIEYTCSEIIEIGLNLELPEWAVVKRPSDGLIGVTDEEKFGFTYKELDFGILFPEKAHTTPNHEKIEKMHKSSWFKRAPKQTCHRYYKIVKEGE